ncbi:uncharacterized protein LOC114194907 [Vigna unguiculata]|uniref:Uncharacterized protein n=1 Tax=Vigna unguiculata TaxID=3917 RepID=A0A4D6MCX8_VIGUN|nr:uncharacterized protein LOC114194907 [Vigna unguiculata]QCD98630.1 hypothetical protein DEO72_LG6g3352 [Vigna unguiculata]
MKRCEMVFETTTRGGCKEHPHDKQSPGVCSSCLREKLSQLYSTNPIIDPLCFSPQSPASPHQSFSSSRGGGHRKPRFRRNASLVAAESGSSVQGLNLKKSKSHAFGSKSRGRERDVSGRKKDGFWSKVLKLKIRDTRDSIVTSKTST